MAGMLGKAVSLTGGLTSAANYLTITLMWDLL